jgi:hypothetical protein
MDFLLHIQWIPRVLLGNPEYHMQVRDILLTYSPSNKEAS